MRRAIGRPASSSLAAIFVAMVAAGCIAQTAPAATEPEAPPAATESSAAATEPSGPDAEMEVLGLQLLREAVDIMLANQDDCDRMAAELDRFSEARREPIQRFNDWWEQKTPEEREAHQQRHKQDLDALRQEMAQPLVTCGANPSVRQAVERLD